MKLPEYLNRESSHMTNVLNTCTLTGISLLWGVMLGLISPWWNLGVIFFLAAGYGSEVRKRTQNGQF